MTDSSSYTRRGEFFAGMKASIPLVIGATPFAIIFGAVAVASGVSPAATAGMSAFVFAGSAQFIAVNMLAGGAAPLFIVLTTFVVNLRHSLYSATLGPHMKHLSQRWLVPLAFTLTDESFVIAYQRYERDDVSPHKHWFLFGSEVIMYTNWQLWTWIGIIAGQRIPDPAAWGLDFAMYVTFIGMVIPMTRTRPVLVSVAVASVTALLTHGLPNQLGLLVAALAGIVAGVIAQSTLPSAPPTPMMESEAGS